MTERVHVPALGLCGHLCVGLSANTFVELRITTVSCVLLLCKAEAVSVCVTMT